MILTGLGRKTEKLFKDLIYAFTMVICLRINSLFEPTQSIVAYPPAPLPVPPFLVVSQPWSQNMQWEVLGLN